MKKKRKRTFLIIGGVVVVLIIVILNLSMSTSNALSVQAEEAIKRDLVETVSASGRIQPQTKVDITSEINGEIIGLYAREGDQVQSGDLLIVLDTVQLRSDVDQAQFALNEYKARLEGAESGLDQAREEFERQERLYQNDLTSETAYKNAKYAYLTATSAQSALQSQTKQFESRYEKQLDYLSKAKIVAPMSGIVTYVDCEVGEIAAAQTAYTQGKTLITISNLDVFEVEVEVDETEITKVELSQEVEIEVDAFPDTTFTGRVVEIGNTAILSGLGTQDQSTDFRVKVIFNEPDVKIRPGMSATVDITTERRDDVLSVPYSAVVMRSFDADSLRRAQQQPDVSDSESTAPTGGVQAAENDEDDTLGGRDQGERQDLKGVFLIRDGVVKFVEITTGIADQKNIEITGGLEDGDTVVTGPYRVLRSIKDGDAVTIQKQSGRSSGDGTDRNT